MLTIENKLELLRLAATLGGKDLQEIKKHYHDLVTLIKTS